jgi:hypothetical protein
MQIINGVTYNVTAPIKYSMQYAFEKVEYNEPFVIIDFSKEAAQQYLDTFDTWVNGISGFFLGTGATGAAATLGISAAVCAAIAGIVEVAGNIIKGWAINDDGSVSLCLSYHYAGTRKAGIDLTATPLPGLDPNEWYKIVNGLMVFRMNVSRAKELGIENEAFLQFSAPNNLLLNGASLEGSPYNEKETLMASNGGFYESFSSCMATSGMPVPSSLFGTAERAIGTLSAIYAAYSNYGSELTLGLLVEEGVLGDFALSGSAILASAYLGACIGCCIYAGVSAADLPSMF